MNRNAVVGVAILGVALSGVSIGSATYLSSKSVEATSRRLSSELHDEAGRREELASRTEAKQDTLLAIKGGVADGLAAEGEGYALWSRGRFVVSSPEEGGVALFEVDPTTESIASSGDLGIGGRLVVADAVDAAEMRATGRVLGTSLATRGFAVDSQGDMTGSSLTLANNANICGDLVVKGSRIELGPAVGEDPALAFSNDSESGKWVLAVHGAVKARELNIIENGAFAAGNGSFRIDSSGGTTVGGELAVSGPATFSGTFVVGDMQAGRAAIGGLLTARGAEIDGEVSATNARLTELITAPDGIFDRSLAVSGSATFRDVLATNVDVGGTLSVQGSGVFADAIAAAHVAADDVAVRGSVSAASASITGALGAAQARFTGDVAAGGNVTADSLVLAGVLVSADGRFVVDRTGDTHVTGRLTVGGDAAFASALTVGGDATFGSIHSGPITSGSVTSTGLLATSGDVSCGRLLAANRIALANDRFVVSSAGNVTAAGSLQVAGDITASGSLRVEGSSVMDGGLAVSGGLVLNGREIAGIASGSVSLVATGSAGFPSDIPASARLVVTPTSGTDGNGGWWVTDRTLYSEGARSFDWIATW